MLNPTFAFWLPNFEPLPNYPSVEGPRDQKVTAYHEPACVFTGGFKVANIEEPTNFGHQLPAKPFSRMRSEGFPFIVGGLGVGPLFAASWSARRFSRRFRVVFRVVFASFSRRFSRR